MSEAHHEAVRRQFAGQAATYVASGFAVQGLGWIVDLLCPRSGDRVLDVAAGAAHLGRALAPRVAHVAALDLTPEMLAQGERLTRDDGLDNVAFLRGDAAALPFDADRFDLVVCRLTLHQVADAAAVVSEMVRVARPGGRVGITDMVADADPVVAAETDRLERLRDPSHARMLTLPEITGLLEAEAAPILAVDTRDHDLDLEDWLARSNTPGDARAHITARIAEDLDGGTATGLRPFRRTDGAGFGFVHRWATVVARVR